jgi:hypothetical protein
MFDTSSAANGAVEYGRIPRAEFSIPGPVAAAIWALGLVIGVLPLVNGNAGVAVVALVMAVAAPWFGLAWISQCQRRAYNVALYLHGSRADGLADLPTSPHGLRFTAR